MLAILIEEKKINPIIMHLNNLEYWNWNLVPRTDKEPVLVPISGNQAQMEHGTGNKIYINSQE